MFDYHQVLYQMQQGLSDRAIARGGLIGRQKASKLRCLAVEEGWLKSGIALPYDATLGAIFDAPKRAAAGPSFSLKHIAIE